MGPKPTKQVQPVRPVVSTGQTGPAQADRRSFGFVLCRVSLKLMTLINLITEDKYLGGYRLQTPDHVLGNSAHEA